MISIRVWTWDYKKKFTKLLKKRSREIELFPIRKRIPLIRPPEVLMVDLKGFIGGVDRNDRFSGGIAVSFVELAFVAE